MLKLNNDETTYLISPKKLFVTQEEVNKVVSKMRGVLDNSKKVAYLLDNLRRIRYGGKKALEFFGVSEDEVKNLYGMSILEVIFNPNLKFRQFIDKESFEALALSRIVSFQTELGFLIDNNELDLIKRLKEFPDFERLWEKAKTLKIDPHLEEERTMRFKNGSEFYFAVIPVEYDRRFEVVEYIGVGN
ncbi:MAG TPA: hypothetical protein ENI23_03065 [bacterium]|nr:hypothetical protein [bacterium]